MCVAMVIDIALSDVISIVIVYQQSEKVIKIWREKNCHGVRYDYWFEYGYG